MSDRQKINVPMATHGLEGSSVQYGDIQRDSPNLHCLDGVPGDVLTCPEPSIGPGHGGDDDSSDGSKPEPDSAVSELWTGGSDLQS